MTRRDRMIKSLEFQDTGIVPWSLGFTRPCEEKLREYYGTADLEPILGNYIAGTGASMPGGWKEVRPGFWADQFGVVWDRTIDTDIGTPCEFVLPEPTLADYTWPDPTDPRRYIRARELFEKGTDKFVLANFGFSLFERAWTMRGMDKILMDMVENEEFLDELLDTITEWNLQAVRRILKFPVDGVMFGDDWGSQRGLIMGPRLWRRFVKPRVARLYGEVRKAGRKVFIHSCGDVDEVFDDLVEVGLNVFNPFQPEVMDTFALSKQYKGRLAFWGGISTQKLLPYGTPEQVRTDIKDILKRIGGGGGYIASPAHETPKDVPIENLVALIETITKQKPR